MEQNESNTYTQYNHASQALTSMNGNFCSCSNEQLLRIADVIKITGLSRSYIYELSSKGLFPHSISLVPGGTSKAWVASEVNSWIEERITASRTIH